MDPATKNSGIITLVPLLLVFQVGCMQAPALAAAPPDTRVADEFTIMNGEAGMAKDFTAKDPDKILAHYADTGKEAIRAGLKEVVDDPKFSLDLVTRKVEVSTGGDLAYSQGTYTVTATDARTKKVVTEKGKYVEVYKKPADGSWKIVEDINNADAPARPVK
jgi:ketosteroid isomerase-like protein